MHWVGKAASVAKHQILLQERQGCVLAMARLFFLPWDTASGAQAGYARHFIGRQVEVT